VMFVEYATKRHSPILLLKTKKLPLTWLIKNLD